MQSLIDGLRRALAEQLPGPTAHQRLMPKWRIGAEAKPPLETLRHAAALLLLYRHRGAWHIPLTVRGASLQHHTGQVSLPGGRIDPGESVEGAALREAREELGIIPTDVQLLGRLTPVPIVVSQHLLHPVVGWLPGRPAFLPAAAEVDQLVELPVSELRAPNVIKWEVRQRSHPPEVMMDVPYFDVAGLRVWGATAMVLSEFLDVLASADSRAYP